MTSTLRVGDLVAKPGQLTKGFLEVADMRDGANALRLPVILVNGQEAGPTLYLHSGSHGQEAVTGVEVIRRITRELVDPAALRGRLVTVPIANPLAHEAAWRVAPVLAAREHVPYPGDPARNFPGNPNGSLTQRICHVLWQEIVLQADVVLDCHTIASPGMSFVLIYQGNTKNMRDTEVWQRSVALARAFGTTIIEYPPTSGSLQGSCLEAGIPAITPEVWDARSIGKRALEVYIRGTMNVLKHLNMIDGAQEPHEELPVLGGFHPTRGSVRANRGGIIHYEREPGVPVRQGEVIARIYSAFGDLNEEVLMPVDGYVVCYPPVSWAGLQSVIPGDYIADIIA